jgi:starch-binding outer membrane protein, SusD/RagB family
VANGSEASNWIYRFAPHNSGSNLTFGLQGPGGAYAGWNIPTFDMVRAYEDGDLRKDASIGFYVRPGNREHDVAIGDSIPFIRKYHHPFDVAGQTRENWPVYGYGRVLLLLAEALNEVGQTGEAATYLNQVRKRAGLEPLSVLSQVEFRKAVAHEQRLESAFENHRWYDLKRTDRAIEVMLAHGQEMQQRIPRLTAAAYSIEPFKLLYPIPYREVRLNNLEQNPGW